MSMINVTAGKKGKRTKTAEAKAANVDVVKILQEFDLLLEEIERLLEEELIQIYLLRKGDKEKQVADLPAILKILIRLLGGKKNRSIRQEAILAYAKMRLSELAGEKSQESL